MTRDVVCGYCDGTGWLPMSRELQKTLRALVRGGLVSTRALAKATATKQTAACNRLCSLESLGYAERMGRRREGTVWRATDKANRWAKANVEGGEVERS